MILDGGLATELEKRGYDISDKLWSARLLRDAPSAIRAVHADYVAAGAQCLITASYQATLATLTADHLRLSVRLAREAAPQVVAASVGPYGAARADGSEYTGAYDLDEDGLHAWHAERFAVLADAGADLLACETIPSFPEARALCRLLEATPHAAAWFSFCCRDGARIADGTPLADCAAYLEDCPQVVAVGLNCTAPRHVLPLLAKLRTGKKVVVYPNSGEAWDPVRRVWTGEADPAGFAALAVEWRRAGADWIGGCCRTGPEHIRALRRVFPGDVGATR